MKTKITTTIICILFLNQFLSAIEVQRIIPAIAASGGKCFDENTKIINVGIGFGGVSYYKYNKGKGYDYGRTPTFSFTYEQAFKQKLGIGYLGIGAYLGYQNAHYRYDNWDYNGGKYYYKHNWNYFLVASRAAYHFDVLNSEKAEVYVGAIIGLRIQTYSYSSNHPDPYYYDFYRERGNTINPAYSIFAGARWYFSKNVGFFGELGYGISYTTVGMSFKF